MTIHDNQKGSDLNSQMQNYTHFPGTYLLTMVTNSMDHSIKLFFANFTVFILEMYVIIFSDNDAKK